MAGGEGKRTVIPAALLAVLLAATPAGAATLWEEGGARLSVQGGRAVLESGGQRLLDVAGTRFELRPAARIAGQAGAALLPLLVQDASGGWAMHGIAVSPRGVAPAGSVALGRTPFLSAEGGAVLVGDPALDALPDGNPGATVPLRLVAGRLMADAEAMRRLVPVALAPEHCPAATLSPPAREVEDAARRARGDRAEATRLAACLLYAGRPQEARRLLAQTLGAGAGAAETALARAAACSSHATALRRASPADRIMILDSCPRS